MSVQKHRTAKKILTFILPAFLAAVLHSWAWAEDIIVDIGNGSGAAGSQNNTISLSLNNSAEKVKGFQLYICDEGNYLTIRDCVTTGHASNFSCLFNECLTKASSSSSCRPFPGCAKVALYSIGETIKEGAGPVALVKYDVSEDAPSGCFDLIPKAAGAQRAGTPGPGRPNEVSVMADIGQFCIRDNSGDDTTTTSIMTNPEADTEESSSQALDDSSTPLKTRQSDSNASAQQPPSDGTTGKKSGALSSPEIYALQQGGGTGGSSAERKEKRSSRTTTTITAAGSSPSQLIISPSTSVINSKGVVALDARTIADGKEVPGKYTWEIVPPSTIGSTIDENGVFTAGKNTSSLPVEETIRVTDSVNAHLSSLATITIESAEEITEGCSLSITPSSAELVSGSVITFTAQPAGKGCTPGAYEWKVNSKIGSTITAQGIYTAGSNKGSDSALDIVIVKDNHADLETNALIKVLSGAGGPQTASSIQDNFDKIRRSGRSANTTIMLVVVIIAGMILIGRVLLRNRKH